MNHTPGPWKYDDEWALIVGPNDEEICAIHAAQSSGERRVNRNKAQANGRLIAAAPELLAALKDVIQCWNEHGVALTTEQIAEAEHNMCNSCRQAQSTLNRVKEEGK